jgi:hypothetical protein
MEGLVLVYRRTSASSQKWEAYRWLEKGLDVSVLSPK